MSVFRKSYANLTVFCKQQSRSLSPVLSQHFETLNVFMKKVGYYLQQDFHSG